MRRSLWVAATVAAGMALASGAAWADEPSEAEAAAINATLAKLGCKADEIEKEAPGRFEIDDATCEMGQYDFKLDGDYRVVLMSLDQ